MFKVLSGGALINYCNAKIRIKYLYESDNKN